MRGGGKGEVGTHPTNLQVLMCRYVNYLYMVLFKEGGKKSMAWRGHVWAGAVRVLCHRLRGEGEARGICQNIILHETGVGVGQNKIL